MQARGIHHLGVAVEDLDEAVTTYERIFGAELEHRETVPDQGVELVDEKPHLGLFGLQVAFLHPDAVHGVLAELVTDG